MQIAVPVADERGSVRGALALVINPDQEFARILSVARAGKSSETYVLDQRGLMLSRSRFEAQLRELGLIENRPGANSAAGLRLADPGPREQAAARSSGAQPRRPLTWLVANAVVGGSGVDVDPSRDYRGIPVVGAWRWMPQHGFGVVTQLDADEAFAPLRVLNLLFTILFLLLALCATGLFLASYLGALWRHRLSEANLSSSNWANTLSKRKLAKGHGHRLSRSTRPPPARNGGQAFAPGPRGSDLVTLRARSAAQLATKPPVHDQVYDYGQTAEGIFYYAMELLRGFNLQDLVGRTDPSLRGASFTSCEQVCGRCPKRTDSAWCIATSSRPTSCL